MTFPTATPSCSPPDSTATSDRPPPHPILPADSVGVFGNNPPRVDHSAGKVHAITASPHTTPATLIGPVNSVRTLDQILIGCLKLLLPLGPRSPEGIAPCAPLSSPCQGIRDYLDREQRRTTETPHSGPHTASTTTLQAPHSSHRSAVLLDELDEQCPPATRSLEHHLARPSLPYSPRSLPPANSSHTPPASHGPGDVPAFPEPLFADPALAAERPERIRAAVAFGDIESTSQAPPQHSPMHSGRSLPSIPSHGHLHPAFAPYPARPQRSQVISDPRRHSYLSDTLDDTSFPRQQLHPYPTLDAAIRRSRTSGLLSELEHRATLIACRHYPTTPPQPSSTRSLRARLRSQRKLPPLYTTTPLEFSRRRMSLSSDATGTAAGRYCRQPSGGFQ
ncbi:hypothetical protein C8T65DRAFT_697984 [Cerioporus squamosus]|nr:hypothetical protein C8T65DRAFT_697984 [Cerioporus squamosus]